MRYRLLWLIIIFITNSLQGRAQDISENNTTDIICGAERLHEYLPLLEGKKVGIIMNQGTRVGKTLLVDTLLALHVNVVKIFVPEHGLRGSASAGEDVNSDVDKKTGLPIVSIYGKNKKPTPEQLENVDIVIYDLQDVGVRFYTYISTLQYAMEACAENNKQLIVLDRPDPNGFYVDGPLLDTSLASFVGMQPVPVVYGMTYGEYAKMLMGEHWSKNTDNLQMVVIPCARYDHSKKYLLKYPPSPNLKTMSAVYLYPSLCLFEGTVVSLGRGTDKPFQQWGHPDFKGKTDYYFVPQNMTGASKPLYEGKQCWGQLVADDKEIALNVTSGKICLKWLLQAYNWSGLNDRFFTNYFESLAGTKELRKEILAGKSEAQIRSSWQKDIVKFKKIRKKYLLYPDFE